MDGDWVENVGMEIEWVGLGWRLNGWGWMRNWVGGSMVDLAGSLDGEWWVGVVVETGGRGGKEGGVDGKGVGCEGEEGVDGEGVG